MLCLANAVSTSLGTLFLFFHARVLTGFLLLLMYACYARWCFVLYNPIYPSERGLKSKAFTKTLMAKVLCACLEWYNSILEGETAGIPWQGGSFNRKPLAEAFQCSYCFSGNWIFLYSSLSLSGSIYPKGIWWLILITMKVYSTFLSNLYNAFGCSLSSFDPSGARTVSKIISQKGDSAL